MAPRCPAPIAHRSAHPSSLRIARSQPERRSHTDRSPPHWRRGIPHPPGEAAGRGDFAQAHANSRAGSWRCWSQPRPRLRRPAPRPPRPGGALPGPAPDGESNPRLSTWSPSTPIMSARRIAGHDGLLPRSHDGPIRLSGSAPATCPRDPASPCAAAPDPLIDSRSTCTSTIRHDVTGIDDTITPAAPPSTASLTRSLHLLCDPPAPTPGPISRDQTCKDAMASAAAEVVADPAGRKQPLEAREKLRPALADGAEHVAVFAKAGRGSRCTIGNSVPSGTRRPPDDRSRSTVLLRRASASATEDILDDAARDECSATNADVSSGDARRARSRDSTGLATVVAPATAGGGSGRAVDDGRVNHRPEEDVMESIPLLDRAGRRRSPATTSSFSPRCPGR